MEIAKLFLEFLKTLIWPATVLTLALIFKAPIKAILARLRKAGLPGGVSIDFQEEIKEVKQLSQHVEALPAPPGRAKGPGVPLTEANARMLFVGLQPTLSGLDMSYFRRIASSDPILALAGLRIEVEVWAQNLAKGYKLDSPRSESIIRLLHRLRDHGAITSEQMKLGRKILSVCNQAVHGQPVSQAEAEEVIEAAGVLARDYLAWLSWGFHDDWSPKAAETADPS